MKSHLTANEAAKLLKVDRATITRWIKKGLIADAQRPSGTRRWRIPLLSSVKLIRRKHEGR